MEKMRGSFGRLMHKGPGNNAKVSEILKDFEDADSTLAKIVEGGTTWRDSWVNLAQHQFGIATEFQALYDPIVGASIHSSQRTPEAQLNRTFALTEAYQALKDELIQEVVVVDSQVIQPAGEAQKLLQGIRKTIKKREERMVSYERAQDKVAKLQRKGTGSAKDDAALAKAEMEMSMASEEFQIADDHLQGTLPSLCQAAFSLIPYLMAALISIENRLLGLYYTVVHEYCQGNGFSSPPPPIDDVVAEWTAAYQPVQADTESLYTISSGKAIHQPMNAGSSGTGDGSRSNAPRPTGLRRITTWGSSKDKDKPEPESPSPRVARISSVTSITPSISSDRSPALSRQSSRSTLGHATEFTTASSLVGSAPGSVRMTPSYTPSRERGDYFGHETYKSGNGSAASTPQGINVYGNGNGNGSNHTGNGSITAAALAKKKPPPPPPPKKRAQQAPAEYVIAEHDYQSGQAGDLSFNEGDKIRITKRTATMQDWWEGEVNGRKGAFPANYCRQA